MYIYSVCALYTNVNINGESTKTTSMTALIVTYKHYIDATMQVQSNAVFYRNYCRRCRPKEI